MWIVLAVSAFIVGQGYLFHCLGKLDRFLEQQSKGEREDQKILSIAFADPTTANYMAELLDCFSVSHPEIEISLLTGQDVLEAVCAGKAAVGFLPAGHHTYPGLHCLPLKMKTAPVLLASAGMQIAPMVDSSQQEMIWKRSAILSPADIFAGFLRDRGTVGCRNAV